MIELKWNERGEAHLNREDALFLIAGLYEDAICKLGDDYRKYELGITLQSGNRSVPECDWVKSELRVEYSKEMSYYTHKEEPDAIASIERMINLLGMEDDIQTFLRYNIELVLYV